MKTPAARLVVNTSPLIHLTEGGLLHLLLPGLKALRSSTDSPTSLDSLGPDAKSWPASLSRYPLDADWVSIWLYLL